MEFVGGQSLDKLLSRNDHKLPLETALQLTLELAEALDCAHGQGVVHRDLKPANILLTEDGHAKIADFGVAKLNLANHTLAGRALGTPAYMSPEQLNGEAVDGRSDLFSLGVVLYTVLTGYRPFQGNSAITVSFKVVNRDPLPATVLDTTLPQGLDYIIARAMAKDPAERYQRGMEMVLDIQELREGREPWSKAKQPGLPAGRSAGQKTKEEGRLAALGQLGIAANPRSSARALSLGRGAAENLLDKMRKRSLAGALLLAGLLIFGIWVISFGSRRVQPRAAEALPLAKEAASVKTGAATGASRDGRCGCGSADANSARRDSRFRCYSTNANCGKALEAGSSRPNPSVPNESRPRKFTNSFSSNSFATNSFSRNFSGNVGDRGGAQLRGGQFVDLGG